MHLVCHPYCSCFVHFFTLQCHPYFSMQFFMPLFVLVVGMVVQKYTNRYGSQYVLMKVAQEMYLSWSLVSVISVLRKVVIITLSANSIETMNADVNGCTCAYDCTEVR